MPASKSCWVMHKYISESLEWYLGWSWAQHMLALSHHRRELHRQPF